MKRLVVWFLKGLGILLVVAIGALGAVMIVGTRNISASPGLPASHERITEPTSASPENGERLAEIYDCVGCHEADLGGQYLVNEWPFGRLAAPNLTPGRTDVPLTLETFERAVRHGIGPDGRMLLVMPSSEFTDLTDAEVADLFAYTRGLDAVDRVHLPLDPGPMMRVFAAIQRDLVAPSLRIDHTRPHVERFAEEASAERGAALAKVCAGCHGPDLGGQELSFGPGSPTWWAPNLTPHQGTGLGAWSAEDFGRSITEGLRPDGVVLDSIMPWDAFSRMRPVEIGSLWIHLSGLAPIDRPRPAEFARDP